MANQGWTTSQGCSQPLSGNRHVSCEVQMNRAEIFAATLQQPLTPASSKQFQDLLDPVNSHALSTEDLHGMVCSLTCALERLSVEQHDTTSLALHMDMYAKVLDAGAARAQASLQTCSGSQDGGWQAKPVYQALVAMLTQGAATFSQVLASQSYMLPAALPGVVALAQPLLALSRFTFFSSRLVAGLGVEQFNEASLSVRNAIKDLSSMVCSVIATVLTGQDDTATPEGQQQVELCQQASERWVQALLSLGQQVADIVAQPTPAVPKEMRSFAVLNMAWTSLAKLLAAIPQPWRRVALNNDQIVGVLSSLLGYMRQQLQQASEGQYDDNRLQVIRFWLQLVAKVSGAYPSAAGGSWQQLLATALCVYRIIHSSSDKVQLRLATDLHDVVAPKLVAALLLVLSSEADELSSDSLAAKVQQLASPAAALSSSSAGTAEPGDWELMGLSAQLALVSSLLLRSQSMQQPLRLLAAEHLLPWLMKTTCIDLYDQVLLQDMGLGSIWTTSLQACLTLLICCHGAAACPSTDQLQEHCQRAWSACQLQLFMLAAQQHPLLQHMACELMCVLVASGQPAFVEQQLRTLCQLVKVVAGVESLALASQVARCERGGALAHVLGRALQAAPLQVRLQLLHEMLSEEALHGAARSLPGAAAAALLADALLGACSGELPPHQLDQVMMDLWTQAQQVFQQSKEGQWGAAELQLQQHHLAWLLEGIAVAAHHSIQCMAPAAAGPGAPARAANPSSDILATCVLLAADIIAASAPCSPQQQHAQQQAGAAATPYVPAALHILAQAGDFLDAPTLSSIVPALTQLQSQPACAMHVAAISAHLGPVQPAPVDLFHSSLLDRHWALSNTAMESLVAFARTSRGDYPSVIPPQLKSAPVHELFVARLRGFMGRQLPEHEQLVQEQHAPNMLQQEAQQLKEACSGDSRHQALLANVARGLQMLEGLVAEAAAAEPMQVDGLAHLGMTHPVSMAVAKSMSQAAVVLDALGVLERSMHSLQSAAMSSLQPDDMHTLGQHTAPLLGDLVSISSKVRALQDVIYAMREGPR